MTAQGLPITINGETCEIDSPGDMPLLWALGGELGMVGTEFGCGIGMCGACTVNLDGRAARSCSTPLEAVVDRQGTTIEHLETTPVGRVLQQAWLDEVVMQCGSC